jgi:hypothetical protein
LLLQKKCLIRPSSKGTNEKDEKVEKDVVKEQHLRQHLLLQKKCLLRPSFKETDDKIEKDVEKEQQMKRRQDASSDEEIMPEAVAVVGVFTGPTGPSVVSEPRGRYAEEPSLIIAELAEPSQEEEELRRRNQELEAKLAQIESGAVTGTVIVENESEAVTGTVIVENSGAGDHDQNTAPSPFGRKGRRFWIGSSLALLLVVGVIFGVIGYMK